MENWINSTIHLQLGHHLGGKALVYGEPVLNPP